jgi:hypothetical protein
MAPPSVMEDGADVLFQVGHTTGLIGPYNQCMTIWGKLKSLLPTPKCKACSRPLPEGRQDACSDECEQELVSLQAW